MLRTPTIFFLLALVAGIALAVHELADFGSTDPLAQDPGSPAEEPRADEPRGDVQLAAARHEHERPLPAFKGLGLDGDMLSVSDFIGKRLVLYFFNPEMDEMRFVSDAVARISELQGKYNFTVLGVAVGSSRSRAQTYAKRVGLDFPIFDDSNGRIVQRLGIRQPFGVYGVDPEGYLEYGLVHFMAEVPDASGIVEDQLRDKLRLPERNASASGALDPRPRAPLFRADASGSDDDFVMADALGKPIVLVFFLHTCPHCHKALEFFKAQLPKIPEAKRPRFVGISGQNRPSTVRSQLEGMGLDFFPVLFDPSQEIMREYGVFAGFPDVLLIDASGKIVHRTQGWRDDRDPALNRMYLAKISGIDIPMLLNPKGYTGNDVCSVCHELEALSWDFTQHAGAYDTLVTHGETGNAECVSCHVVGFDKPGGYSFKEAPAQLENVGCESCHGRGGPHVSKDAVKKGGSYEEVCKTCHNPTHSLGFDYETFRPKISHTAIATMSNEARAELVAAGAKPRNVLPTAAKYVGSDACKSCHEAEYKTWSKSPHGHAVDRLAIEGKAGEKDCLKCHTTAMGLPGGFPNDADGTDPAQRDLAKVGCESCHGPGGDHIAESAEKFGTIVSLGDKCDSCVILQICGSCHDEANDPGFEFEVEAKIERQRHGTTEPGTSKPIDRSVRARDAKRELREDLAHAFRLIDGEG